jgi:hypothetical protein
MHSREDVLHSRRATPDVLAALTQWQHEDAPLVAEVDWLIEAE